MKNLTFIVLLTAICSNSTFAQGKLTFIKTSHNFGVLVEGDKPTYTFILENTGDQPIVLAEVKPSCGCTTPYYSKAPILPGSRDSIVVAYSTRGRLGRFTKSIQVISNAAPNRQLLRINGSVIQPVSVNNSTLSLDEKRIELGRTQPNKEVFKTIQVTNTGTDALSVKGVQSDCNCAMLQNEINLAPGSTAALSISITPEQGQKGTYRLTFVASSPQSKTDELSLSFDADIPVDYQEVPNETPNAFGW